MQQQELTCEATKGWLGNHVIQKNLRLTIPDGNTRDHEKTRELTNADVREVLNICDSIFHSIDK